MSDSVHRLYLDNSRCVQLHPILDVPQEACVLESHPSLAAAAQSMTAALRDEAATTIRAALAVNPAAAELWGALGTVCHTSAQQEYALCRSLQLDRAAAWVWVALGRLYVAEGEGALADGCFEQARCANAATGSVWEAMGAAALALQQGVGAVAVFMSVLL